MTTADQAEAMYRLQERLAICEDSGVSHERAEEIARAEAEKREGRG